MWKLLLALPSWILYLILDSIFYIFGWILVPTAAAFKAYKKENELYHFTWPFMFPWDNYGDGIANDTYYKAPNMFLQILYWSCVRNPTNNLRIVPILSCNIDPSKVDFIGNFGSKKQLFALSKLFNQPETTKEIINKYDTKVPQWFFAWQGLYSNFYWQFMMRGHLWRFWIGWKIYPTDVYGVTEYRKFGAGFALQFKKVV